jgi:tetratricopeptide (TPR) repeat protein
MPVQSFPLITYLALQTIVQIQLCVIDASFHNGVQYIYKSPTILKTTMFGLFGKKKYLPTVTSEDKDWVEKNIIWFIEVFGLAKLREQPFILPTTENFPYNNLHDTDQFQKLFEQLCGYWNLNPNEIVVKFFDDIKSKQWTSWTYPKKFKEATGRYYQTFTAEEKHFNIELAKSNLNNPQLLVSVMAHELAHVKLLGENFVNRNDPDMEPLTDLAVIYFGFGIFMANSVFTKELYWMGRTGYLPNQLISYANALICYLTEHDVNSYLSVLNTNTRELFKQDFEFLTNTNDTTLTRDKVSESESIYRIGKQITEGFEKRIFNNVIEAGSELLETDPKNIVAFNNIGYALLQQKKYQEAINQFTKAIDIDPHFDYAFNNRGYCKLQLGDIENAFFDLHCAFEMNPNNSFSWRNMGAYYLNTKELDKALRHFEEAEKIDPKTELINFYLGQAHLKMGNTDKSKFYLDKSVELNEHNDSVFS